MNKIILLLCLIVLPIIANENTEDTNPFLHDDHFPGGYFLMSDSLPHFMGIYMKRGGSFKIKPNTKQEELIEKQFDKMVHIIMSNATQIKSIETSITTKVMNEGKTAKELSAELDKVAKLRKEMTILQIECLNIFKETLTAKQYQMMIDLALQEHKHK